jgi:type II secretory pathway component PulJ
MQHSTYKKQDVGTGAQRPSIKHRASSIESAFTVAELLMALAVTAILLTAVAVALNASVMNYQQNEHIFKAVNSARQALFRITTQLRTAEAVATNDPSNECTLLVGDPPNTSSITYRYDSSDNKLYLITNDDLTDDDYVLCENVTAMTFNRQIVVEAELTYVKSVMISITVVSGNVQKTVAAAAVVRRNLQ